MNKKKLTKKTDQINNLSRTRRSSSQQEIIDEKFKLPFKYGWKREFVLRSINNSKNKTGDVYYYSPNKQKLRSLREIKKQLNLSLNDENPLTIDCFTFLNQPIGINDKSKEIVRNAHTKMTKKDSIVGISVQHEKKVETSSNNQNYKSSNKIKIDDKNVKRLQYKKEKNIVEAMDVSPSTPEYIAEDKQTIESTKTSKVVSSKANIEEMRAPYKKILQPKEEHSILISKPTKICMENPVGLKLSEQISTLNVQLKINHVSSEKETSSSNSQDESLKMQIRNTDNEVSYEISSPDVMNEILHAVKTIICEKHPAPLPAMPNQMSCPAWKKIPPSPILNIAKDKETLDGFTLEWNLHIDNSIADIKGYQIYYYCENGRKPSTELWIEYCTVVSIPLPITMKLYQFERGLKYYFSIRAVDVHSRVGPFCIPKIVYLE